MAASGRAGVALGGRYACVGSARGAIDALYYTCPGIAQQGLSSFPCDGGVNYARTTTGRVRRRYPHPLIVEQAQTLLATARGHKWEALFTLALATGMRRGELIALKWQDINLKTGTRAFPN